MIQCVRYADLINFLPMNQQPRSVLPVSHVLMVKRKRGDVTLIQIESVNQRVSVGLQIYGGPRVIVG